MRSGVVCRYSQRQFRISFGGTLALVGLLGETERLSLIFIFGGEKPDSV